MSSSSANRPSLGLMLLTIGFCTNLAGEEKLRTAGDARLRAELERIVDLKYPATKAQVREYALEILENREHQS